MVGLLPLCAHDGPAASRATSSATSCWPRLRRRIEAMPELLATIHDARRPGVNGRRMLAVLDETKLRRVLARMLDEDEFLSPHGLRALSRYHADHPFSLDVHGQTLRGRATCRPSPTPGCSAATRTGAARCGSRSTT